MKRKRATDGSSPPFSRPKNINVQKETRSDEIAHSSPIGMMDLPIELRQKILFSLTPKERCNLRLVNKAMLDGVDTSMSDVQEMEIIFSRHLRHYCRVSIKTINPFNSVEYEHGHDIVISSLPFLLNWAGAQLKLLKLISSTNIFENDRFYLDALFRVFEVLNSENTCPKLNNLSLSMEQSLWDKREIVHSELLKYITKRQLEAKVVDHPIRFLYSLSLTSERYPLRSHNSALKPSHIEKRRKFLQDLLDQCHGLKELDVDDLLMQKDLPIVSLRYPTSLTYLRTKRLGKAPADLPTIIDNCPNLQILDVDARFPRDDAEVHALASLFDLRELTLVGYPTEEKIVRIISQCLAIFEDHPFGASIPRPSPQFKSFPLNFYDNEFYKSLTCRFLLSGANCCITLLHLTQLGCRRDIEYARSVQQFFKVLNSEDACPNLMELNINACELVNRVRISLIMKGDSEPQVLEQWRSKYGDGLLSVPERHVYGMLNDLLTYVTKRQSAVRLGKPFLHSLSIVNNNCNCYSDRGPYAYLEELRDQLEQIHTTVQQILDQCHGLEELYMESLNYERINPNKKKGRELMESVSLRFPTTLKKLNGVLLN